MKRENSEQLLECLSVSWPNAPWTDADIAFWLRDLGAFDVDDVILALVEYKNNARFVPKIPEIKSILNRSKATTQAARAVNPKESITINSWRDQYRDRFPDQAGKMSDAEIVMRVHRERYQIVFNRYLKWLPKERLTLNDAERAKIKIEAEALQFAATMLLCACGMAWKDAETMATYIDAPDQNYQPAIDWLHEQHYNAKDTAAA